MSSLQRTPDWYAAKLGKVGASRVADIIARTKTGPSASRANYLAELVAERLTGNAAESYINAAMQHGIDNEADARSAYEFITDRAVVEVGFIDHPTIAMSGASPDGFVGDDGLIELKCPQTATHIATLRGAGIDGKYLTQMQWQMACTGRAWCDFASFDPRMPENMRLFVQRVPRDPATIASLEREVTAFLKELDATVADLRARYERRAA